MLSFRRTFDVNWYTSTMLGISAFLPVWPPIEDLLDIGRKATLVQDLDLIARTITRSRRPSTRTLGPQDKNGISDGNANKILKREFSEGRHTFLSKERVARLTIEEINRMITSPHRWLLQDYVENLERFGEYRVYIFGGMWHSAIATHWAGKEDDEGNWEVVEADSLYSLADVQ